MPQPRPRTAFPTAAAVAAQGLTVDQVDPDHLNFLQHVRADGNSYALDLPASGASPPVTVKYEPGTPAAAPSRAPAGSDRVVEQEIPPADALPWYETATMDEDYRNFWRQTRFENGTLVLQVEDKVVRYMVDAVPVRLSDIAGGEQKKEVPAVAAFGEDSYGVGKKKKDKVAPIKTDRPVLESHVRDSPAHWQNKACVVPGQKVEQGREEKGEGKFGAAKVKVVNREDKMLNLNELPVESLTVNTETSLSTGHDAEPHFASKVKQGREEKGEGKCGAQKIKVVNREVKMLNELPVEKLNFSMKETLNTVNSETSLSIGHNADPHFASGFFGVVWPTHIMERPESSFKEKLLRDLRRTCSLVEYEKLLHQAADRLPATKRRQTRRGVKYYNSSHETNKSYFDSHPDLEKQVRDTSYPNQLALLRGFFFWLKNVTDDDQFRPWSDDFRQYSIIPRE